METKHTAGPWRIDRDPRPGWSWNNHIEGADGLTVCFMAHDGTEDNERGEANAKLIAAAPELLEACRAFVEAWEKCHQLEKTDVALRLAKAAIARVMA